MTTVVGERGETNRIQESSGRSAEGDIGDVRSCNSNRKKREAKTVLPTYKLPICSERTEIM